MKLFKFVFLLYAGQAAGFDLVNTDLSGRWKEYQNESWLPFSGNKKALHFNLNTTDQGTLSIASADEFYVFINNNLAGAHGKGIKWSLDSLKSIYVFPITISVFSKKGMKNLSTSLLGQESGNGIRITQNPFVNAITILAFLLVGVFIFLFFSNGPVMLEYFNFIKIFSIRSTDESALVQRITSFNNVFIYAFLSVLIALNLVATGGSQFRDYSESGWIEILINTLRLSAVILFILLLKIVLINVSAGFFGLNEAAPNQFFNFVRLLLACFVFSSIFQLLVFISGGEYEYWQSVIRAILAITLLLYLVAAFLKLMSKGGFTVFHLFSYICISEIFPAILLLNIFIQ